MIFVLSTAPIAPKHKMLDGCRDGLNVLEQTAANFIRSFSSFRLVPDKHGTVEGNIVHNRKVVGVELAKVISLTHCQLGVSKVC